MPTCTDIASGKAVARLADVYDSRELDADRRVIHAACNDLFVALRRSGLSVSTSLSSDVHDPNSSSALVLPQHARQLSFEAFPKWNAALPQGGVRHAERCAINDRLQFKIHSVEASAQATVVSVDCCGWVAACSSGIEASTHQRLRANCRNGCVATQCRLRAGAASVVTACGVMPPTLNPIIRALMSGLKLDPEPCSRRAWAQALSSLLVLCAEHGRGVVVDKVCVNLSRFLSAAVVVDDSIQRCGATAALHAAAKVFKAQLWVVAPSLLQSLAQPLLSAAQDGDEGPLDADSHDTPRLIAAGCAAAAMSGLLSSDVSITPPLLDLTPVLLHVLPKTTSGMCCVHLVSVGGDWGVHKMHAPSTVRFHCPCRVLKGGCRTVPCER